MSPNDEASDGTSATVLHYPRDATVEAICDLLTQGMSLTAICKKPEMPSLNSVMFWRRRDPDIARKLGEAREIGCETLAEECLRIADEATPETVQVARLRIGTRLRLAAAWAPGQYGRPEQITSSPVIVNIDLANLGAQPKPAVDPSPEGDKLRAEELLFLPPPTSYTGRGFGNE